VLDDLLLAQYFEQLQDPGARHVGGERLGEVGGPGRFGESGEQLVGEQPQAGAAQSAHAGR
jgi:hypothetical protein